MFLNKLCAITLVALLCEARAEKVGEEIIQKTTFDVKTERTLSIGELGNELISQSDCECSDGTSDCRNENGTCKTAIFGAPGKPCDCGPNSVGCTYVNDDKICTCKYNYVQGPNGTCIEPCRCENLGDCVNNVCKCRYQTYGEHCENVEGCEGYGLARHCGDPLNVYCALNFRRGGVLCVCKDPALTFDPKTRTCAECECGPNGYCSFNEGKKTCDCQGDSVVAEKGAELEGECRACECGPNSKGCKFNSTGKFCNCLKGFAQRVSQCKECECGTNATCSFDGYQKVCTCDKGLKMENDTCSTCNCGLHGTCLYDDNYNKVCTCKKDALPYGDTCVECNCGLDGSCSLDKEGKKTCACDKGFGDRDGYCIACQCYFNDETVPCTFNKKIQTCYCPEGYKERDSICTSKDLLHNFPLRSHTEFEDRCSSNFCPNSTNCLNTIDNFECVCKDGFQDEGKDPKIYGCQVIDECLQPGLCPHEDSTRCVSEVGGYECVCKEGYTLKTTNVTSGESPCYQNSKSSKTTFIVVGTLLGLVVIAVPVGFLIYRRIASRVLMK